MTEYTVDKDGNVKSKGKGKKPLPTRYMEGDIPLTIPSIAKKAKSAGKKILKGLKKSPFLKKAKQKKPKVINVAKGGMIIAPKSGSAHYTSKKNSKSTAKKYFKGSF